MPAKTNSDTILRIETLYRSGLNAEEIHLELNEPDNPISLSTIYRRIRKIFLKDKGIGTPKKRLGKQNLPKVRSPANIRKVDKATTGPNCLTQREMVKRFGLSKGTIHTILKKDLKKKLHKKVKTHALSDAQVEKRRVFAPRLLEKLKRGKWKYVISIDESWISMNNINRRRSIHWARIGENVPQITRKKFACSHPKKFMFTAGICSRGKTRLYFVPDRTKVNRWYFINHVLRPIIKYDIPRLYPGEEHKVVLHFDSASSHTAPEVYQYLEENNQKYIHKDDWPPNSPDLALMDFAANGIIKQKLFRKNARQIPGLKRHLTQVWNNFPLSTCYKAMCGWSTRVQRVIDNNGYQIEKLF